MVREARAAYGAMPAAARSRVAAPPADVVRLIERAAHAAGLQRSGRHAAAERLLREVGGSLARRQAFTAAAGVHVTLGRMLLERGRPAPPRKYSKTRCSLRSQLTTSRRLEKRASGRRRQERMPDG